MSGYWLVSKTHIDALITAALRFGWRKHIDPPEEQSRRFEWYTAERHRIEQWGLLTPETADEVGTMLWRANYAVAEYPEFYEPLPEYRFEALPGNPHPTVVLALVNEFELQIGGPDNQAPPAEPGGFCIFLRTHATHRLERFEEITRAIEDDDRDTFRRFP